VPSRCKARLNLREIHNFFSVYFFQPRSKFISIFQDIKPTALIGSAGVGQSFTKEVIEAMSSINKVTPTSSASIVLKRTLNCLPALANYPYD
jgi:hypothetical protein